MAGVGRVAQTRWILHRGRSRSAWMRWGRWSGCGGCRAAAAVASSAEVITIYHLTGETGRRTTVAFPPDARRGNAHANVNENVHGD